MTEISLDKWYVSLGEISTVDGSEIAPNTLVVIAKNYRDGQESPTIDVDVLDFKIKGGISTTSWRRATILMDSLALLSLNASSMLSVQTIEAIIPRQ